MGEEKRGGNWKPCERCILTTVDPKTGTMAPDKEPLKSLSLFRANESGGVFFGQNMVALNEGSIRLGDKVEVLETKPKETYLEKAPVSEKQSAGETRPSR